MSKRLYALLTLVILLYACAAPITDLPAPTPIPITPTAANPATPDAGPQPSFLGIDWNSAEPYQLGLIPSQREQFAAIPGATIYHMSWDIADDLQSLTGRSEIRYSNRENVPLSDVRFRLFPNIIGGSATISAASVNGVPVRPGYDLQNSLLILPLADALQPGQQVTIDLSFRVEVPTDSQANYGVLVSTPRVLTLAHAYPMIPVYDQNGWNAQIPSPAGDLTFTDASFYIVRISAPARLTLVASGVEIASETSGAQQTVTYALGPAHDFMLAGLLGYEKVSSSVGDVTINSYTRAGRESESQSALDTAVEAVNIYNRRYAPYPYTELDIVATPTLALGVEYPGLVAIANRLYEGQNDGSGIPLAITRESTVAHEVAHQWFYNLVGNDQLNQPWLDESLAQFATWQYFSDRRGNDWAEGFKQALDDRWSAVDHEKIPVGQPVSAYTGRAYSAIVYGRGAFFFFALRDEVGQDVFDQFLKEYTRRYTWQIASTTGIEQTAEETCHCSLETLFSAWILP